VLTLDIDGGELHQVESDVALAVEHLVVCVFGFGGEFGVLQQC
jgi:hypothetical protein